jgi:DNA polymerase III subunit delta'
VSPLNAESRLSHVEAHPHARAVLEAALPPRAASHAYLFHGPPGSGKRSVARAFAAALLAEGAQDEAAAAGRVARGTHPDLTWVRPSGASEMLVSDVEGPVVEAATRTPFESRRRVFVIEGAGAMNDQTANRMLKTLEEPLAHVHLILLADDVRAVLPTISSRCQLVRFDAPSAEAIAALLGAEGVEGRRALACARLALGDRPLAGWLASVEGEKLRERIEEWLRAVGAEELHRGVWLELLEAAKQEGAKAAAEAHAAVEEREALLPSKERRRHAREGVEAERRAERRRRAGVLDVGLRLAELWLRDAWCIAEGAPEAVHAVDREEALREYAAGRSGGALRETVDLVAETRLRLQLNVSEELALEALSYRLAALLAR